MAITREYGSLESVAKLAKLAGESIQARREQQRRDESIARAQSMRFQEMMANKVQQDKMELAMFNLEAGKQAAMLNRQWEIENGIMTQQREIDRMEYAKDLEFQYQAKREMMKKQKYDSFVDRINEEAVKNGWDDTTREQLMVQGFASYYGIDYRQPRVDEMAYLKSFMDNNKQQENIPAPGTPQASPAYVNPGMVVVTDPQGVQVQAPAEEIADPNTRNTKWGSFALPSEPLRKPNVALIKDPRTGEKLNVDMAQASKYLLHGWKLINTHWSEEVPQRPLPPEIEFKPDFWTNR